MLHSLTAPILRSGPGRPRVDFRLGLLAVLLAPTPACRTVAPHGGPAFDHVALHVRDLPASAAFYEALGLRRMADPFNDDRHVWLSLGPRQELHLIAGASEAPDRHIDVHFALRVPSVADFTARLDGLGVPYFSGRQERGVARQRPDGVTQIYLRDPDGYWIEVNDVRP